MVELPKSKYLHIINVNLVDAQLFWDGASIN